MEQMPKKVSDDSRKELFWKRMVEVTAILLIILIIMTILMVIVLGINYISNNKVSDNYVYDISNRDKIIMAKVVFAEASIESFECKVAVASVILNRYYSDVPYFHKDSITAVVTQPYQFAKIDNVTMEDLEAVPECMEAVEAACKGWDPTKVMFPEGALYFYAPELVTGHQKEIREGIRVLPIGTVNFHYDFEKVN